MTEKTNEGAKCFAHQMENLITNYDSRCAKSLAAREQIEEKILDSVCVANEDGEDEENFLFFEDFSLLVCMEKTKSSERKFFVLPPDIIKHVLIEEFPFSRYEAISKAVIHSHEKNNEVKH